MNYKKQILKTIDDLNFCTYGIETNLAERHGSNNTNNNMDSNLQSDDNSSGEIWEQKRKRLISIKENDSQRYNKEVLEELKGK